MFIGGGRDAAGNKSDAAAIAEGSVTVNLSTSAVDTQSLGLASYGTTAATSPRPGHYHRWHSGGGSSGLYILTAQAIPPA